jgi:hypothetical protein
MCYIYQLTTMNTLPARLASSHAQPVLDDLNAQRGQQVKQIYERAKAAPVPDPQLPPAKEHAQRAALQHAFEQELWQVCAPFVQTQALIHTLCERVERFLPELFVFVAYPGVPSDNNLAERSVRALVIARKISGGNTQPQRECSPYGTSEPLWYLDCSRSQSFLSVPCAPERQNLLRVSLNSIFFCL